VRKRIAPPPAAPSAGAMDSTPLPTTTDNGGM
jgi:hypothetical protein